MPPVTESGLVELLVQVWLPPKMTGALIALAPEPARMVMPLPAMLPFTAAALRVRVPPEPAAIVAPAVLLVPVPVKFRLLMSNAASSVVLRPPLPTTLLETKTLVPVAPPPGKENVSGPPLAAATQFVPLWLTTHSCRQPRGTG